MRDGRRSTAQFDLNLHHLLPCLHSTRVWSSQLGRAHDQTLQPRVGAAVGVLVEDHVLDCATVCSPSASTVTFFPEKSSCTKSCMMGSADPHLAVSTALSREACRLCAWFLPRVMVGSALPHTDLDPWI